MGLISASEFFDEKKGKISGDQFFCSWDNLGELKVYGLMTNKLASNDASLIWNSYYTKKFHSEVIQDLHFMSPKKSANKQDPLKLLILLQNRIVIIDVQTDTIVSELSPLTEGTLQKTLLFNNNTEAVTYNFVSEEQQNQLMWIDLKKEEPKWTEYVQGIKQIFKIGVEHFAMALEVDNSNKKASMVLLCSTKVRKKKLFY